MFEWVTASIGLALQSPINASIWHNKFKNALENPAAQFGGFGDTQFLVLCPR